MRGIIVSTPIRIVPNRVYGIGPAGLDPQELRTWLLFWDELRLPQQNMIAFGEEGDPSVAYLRQAGVLKFDHTLLTGQHEMSEALVRVRTITYERLEKASPGSWALAFGEKSFDAPNPDDGGRSLQVRLTKALPVPDRDVPLEDILAFREKRQAELAATRDLIDELYQAVLSAPDRPLAETAAVERLARAASEQLDVIREASFKVNLIDIAANFNLLAATTTFLGSLAIGTGITGSLGNSLLAGGSISVANIVGGLGKKTDTPYAYVTAYHEEVFPPG